jgi:hypothetical protein
MVYVQQTNFNYNAKPICHPITNIAPTPLLSMETTMNTTTHAH